MASSNIKSEPEAQSYFETEAEQYSSSNLSEASAPSQKPVQIGSSCAPKSPFHEAKWKMSKEQSIFERVQIKEHAVEHAVSLMKNLSKTLNDHASGNASAEPHREKIGECLLHPQLILRF